MTDTHLILQWNMGCANPNLNEDTISNRLELLYEMIRENRPSLVALQEFPPSGEHKKTLSDLGYKTEKHSNRNLLSGFLLTDWIPKGTDFMALRHRSIGLHLQNNRGIEKSALAFWNIHLQSRYKAQDPKIREGAREFRDAIIAMRRNPQWAGAPEILAGDFNLWPYDESIAFPQGLNANRSLTYTCTQARKSDPLTPPLYNPTWKLFGLSQNPLGSFYATSHPDGPWYVYDQILMSPTLVNFQKCHSGLEMVTNVNSRDLCSSSNVKKPDPNVGSDHFPLIASFVIE